MKRSCFLTDIVFHSNDNYQKTLDHPSYIMKACQIAHEYNLMKVPIEIFSKSDECFYFELREYYFCDHNLQKDIFLRRQVKQQMSCVFLL